MPRVRGQSRLLVPTRRARAPSPPPNPLRFIWVQLDFRRAFGCTPTWGSVRDRLERFDPEQLINFISYLSLVIYPDDRCTDPAVQRALINLLFPNTEQEVVRVMGEFAREVDGQVVIFSPGQLLAATKLAILYARGSMRPGGSNMQALGEALLMMNDLCDFGHRIKADEDVEGALVAGFTAMSTFYHSDNPRHRFARYFGLFLEDHPHLASATNYMNLPAQCRTLMGLDPHVVWTFAFATYAKWLADENIPPIDVPFCITDTYFSQLQLTSDEAAHLMGWLIADYEAIRREVEQQYGDDLMGFDVSVFGKKPLIRFGDRIYCPLPWLLFDQLGSGLYHLFMTRLPESGRRRFMNFTGELYEDYVHGLMRRIFPNASNRYYEITTVHLQRVGTSLCDAIIDYGDSLVLLEYKSKLRSIAARTGLDTTETIKWIGDVYVKPVHQIAATIEAIQKGRLSDLCPDPARFRKFLPLIVTLEATPLLDPIYEDIDRRIKQNRTFPTTMANWQSMHIAELEMLEHAVGLGSDIRSLLVDKLARSGAATSFWNDWVENNPVLAKATNPKLNDEFNRISGAALAWVRARQPADTSS